MFKLAVQRGWYGWILLLFSLVGVVASTWQAIERLNMLKNPGAPLSCDLNPVIDCGSVLSNSLSSLFGFPNAFIGMILFSMLLALSLAIVAGANIKKMLPILLVLTTILLAFSFWFFAVSLYVIGKVCVFCLFIWFVATPSFFFTLREFIANSPKLMKHTFAAWVYRNSLALVLVVFVVQLALYIYRFRDYYL